MGALRIPLPPDYGSVSWTFWRSLPRDPIDSLRAACFVCVGAKGNMWSWMLLGKTLNVGQREDLVAQIRARIGLLYKDPHEGAVRRQPISGGNRGNDGKEPYSGSGSDDAVNAPFVEVLRRVIVDKKVKTVVDLGCGDYRAAETLAGVVPELVGGGS